MKKNKIKLESVILSVSPWMMFLSTGGEAMMQTLFPFIFILLGYYLLLKKKIIFKKIEDKMLVSYTILVTTSSTLSIIFNQSNSEIRQLFSMLYFVFICLWYLILSNEKYDSREKNIIYYSHIIFGIVSSIQVIYFSYIGMNGKLSLISFFGDKINANHFAAILSLLIILQFIKIFLRNKDVKNKIKFFDIFSIFVLLWGLVLTGSRAAFIGTIFSIIIAFTQYIFLSIDIKKLFIIILLITLGVYSTLNLKDILPPWLYNRYIINSYEDESNEIRVHYWRNGISSLKDSPLIGYGTGTLDKIPKYSSVLNNISIPASAPAHNTYIDFMIYGGIVGGFIISSFMFLVIASFLKKHTQYISFIIDLVFLTIIVGADKSIYFWTAFIFMKIMRDENEQ